MLASLFPTTDWCPLHGRGTQPPIIPDGQCWLVTVVERDVQKKDVQVLGQDMEHLNFLV